MEINFSSKVYSKSLLKVWSLKGSGSILLDIGLPVLRMHNSDQWHSTIASYSQGAFIWL